MRVDVFVTERQTEWTEKYNYMNEKEKMIYGAKAQK
jgi:hypothetical protein